ncbi:hypothetical protein [Actinokineospora sp.]|uniref:hypothetical protein n=1 Tax=Actinokineospora sp. TaxID=1872133 RepID=UPI004037C34E
MPSRRGPQLSSRWLASSFVAAYVVVSAAVGTLLLVVPKDDPAAAATIPTYIYEQGPPPIEAPEATVRATPDPGPPLTGLTTATASPSKVALPVDAGTRRVQGPGGLVTVIPAGWKVTRSTGPGAMQATDPADPTRFIRYGGAAAPDADLLMSHVDYDAAFSATKPGFRRISLGTTTYHGVRAVDWEFQYDTPQGKRHVHSMYWRVDGTEYFLYAAANTARWAETLPVYHAMIDNAAP